MHLYHNWKKYILTEVVSKRKMPAIISLLDAFNRLMIPRDIIEQYVNLSLITDKKRITTGEPVWWRWDNIAKQYTKTVLTSWSWATKHSDAKSYELLKSAVADWSERDWVYYYEDSYESLIQKEIIATEARAPRLLYAPAVFRMGNLQYALLTEETVLPECKDMTTLQ